MSDPLKKRYQVFVSSTYQDLVEERRHVIQALLESKCIPSGMELFPASSLDQWTLIQRVIDDCDYYIVIVAGKYGSRGADGRSFTEMEFDYAVETGKPVIGFFHADLDTLPGARLEKNEQLREQLGAFTNKVKRRLCRPWNTPEGLGSAIKSAMLHEIEWNPRPGWIRADAAPDPELILKLKQRVLELEQQISGDGSHRFASGDELLELPFEHRVVPPSGDDGRPWHWPLKATLFKTTWDEVFRVLAHRLVEPHSRRSVKVYLRTWLEKLVLSGNEQEQHGTARFISPSFDDEPLDRVLKTYAARGLLKGVKPPKKSRNKGLHWQLAPKGVRRLAELEAVPTSVATT